MSVYVAYVLGIITNKNYPIKLHGNKVNSDLRGKICYTFLSITVARRAGVSIQRRVFHKILRSQTLLDILQD
jgi:hypothetical protein